MKIYTNIFRNKIILKKFSSENLYKYFFCIKINFNFKKKFKKKIYTNIFSIKILKRNFVIKIIQKI